jgi:NADH:ubiquinone oxidoreductase subunit F (NADH-binding)
MAVSRLKTAIRTRAKTVYLLSIFSNGQSLDIEVMEFAGGICLRRRKTALIASIEGNAAFAFYSKPPFPQKRDYSEASVINNVETMVLFLSFLKWELRIPPNSGPRNIQRN